MCTAISIGGARHLFGRTLDLEYSYGESVVISPEKFPFSFLYEDAVDSHPAIIGTAHVFDGCPLYYDAVNSAGLCAAALNFPFKAVYCAQREASINLASFEIIPYILCKCNSVSDAKKLFRRINIVKDSFHHSLPTTPLHWIFSDNTESIVVEPMADGLHVREDPFGVMTNSPELDYHVYRLSELGGLSPSDKQNEICKNASLPVLSRGLGGVGLPGDHSSSSRFIRAVFAKNFTEPLEERRGEISSFFHVMDTVGIPNGCVLTNEGLPVRTVYTSCVDTSELVYYFTTYSCRRIRAIKLGVKNCIGSALIFFPMEITEDILELN